MCALQQHAVKVIQQRPFSPSNILSHLSNIGRGLDFGNQEDAHEFMMLVLPIFSFLRQKITVNFFLDIPS